MYIHLHGLMIYKARLMKLSITAVAVSQKAQKTERTPSSHPTKR